MTTFVYDMALILGQVRLELNRRQVTFFFGEFRYRSTITVARRLEAKSYRVVCKMLIPLV